MRGFFDCRNQPFSFYGLLEKVSRSFVHGMYGHVNIAVSRQKDDGNLRMRFFESILQFQT